MVLSVTFIPSDTTDYATATAATTILVAPPSPPPPAVTGVIGVSHSKKKLKAVTIGFDVPLNAASAMNTAFYEVLAPVKKHKKTVYSKVVRIGEASLGANGQSVTITLAKPIQGKVQLTVRTGIMGISGAVSDQSFVTVVG